MEHDAVEFLTKHMLCSESLASTLVKEHGLIPYPVALHHATQAAGGSSQNIERELISALRRDKIKIQEVSYHPGTVHIGGNPIANWNEPSINTVNFSELASNDFDSHHRIEQELSRPCFKDIIPPCPNPPIRDDYPSGAKGTATEQAIYLFDPIEVTEFFQSRHPTNSTNDSPKMKTRGGRPRTYDWNEAELLTLGLLLNEGVIPTKKIEVRDYLKRALELMGYGNSMPAESTLDPRVDHLWQILDQTNVTPF